ncbi:MAG: CopD family protein [Nitrospirae bacterium]|nr:CopD family protein [Nitrospirota bacterium]
MLYLWIKALHLISLVSWFAGLFYLPRLFVYYAENEEPAIRRTLLTMQQKLWKIIMMPASLLTALFGFLLLYLTWEQNLYQPWIHLKGVLLLFLYGYHFYLGRILSSFKEGVDPKPGRHYRILNELPTVALVLIMILVVVKPWSR